MPSDIPAAVPSRSLERRYYHRPPATLYLTPAGLGQAYLVASSQSGFAVGESAAAVYGQIAELVRQFDLEIVQERIFGSLAAQPEILRSREREFSIQHLNPEAPLSYIQGHPPWGEGLSGVIIRAVKGREAADSVWTIRHQGRPVGRGWRRHGRTQLLLQNLPGHGLAGQNLREQAGETLHLAAGILAEQGASFRDVVRTWFYLADILAWYGAFNEVRNAFYQEAGFRAAPGRNFGRLPASTGISADNRPGTALTLDLLAVLGDEASRETIRCLQSPAQPEACLYGSAFSRGVLVRERDTALIQVSGTAAINTLGQSMHPGDMRAQIDCTFENVEALLEQAGAGLADVAAACVFVKRAADAGVFRDQVRERGLTNFPAVVMVADICRPELLCEIDAEVVAENNR